MTMKDKMKALLMQNGMFESEAEQVMEMAKNDTRLADMKSRWNDDIEGYPPQLLSSIWFSVKRNALLWIDANIPQAFYRNMFI